MLATSHSGTFEPYQSHTPPDVLPPDELEELELLLELEELELLELEELLELLELEELLELDELLEPVAASTKP